MPTVIKKKMIHGVSSYIQYWKGKPVVDYNPDESPTPPGPTPIDKTEPFYFESADGNAATLTLMKVDNAAADAPTLSIYTSSDKTNWSYLGDTSDSSALTINVPATGKIYLRCAATNWGDYPDGWNFGGNRFIDGTGTVNVGGNIMSLLYGGNFTGDEIVFPDNTKAQALNGIFMNMTSLVDASNLLLPAMTTITQCYRNMFNGCTSLIGTPIIQAVIGGEGCFFEMFRRCTSLTTAPDISGIEVWEGSVNCYYMFGDCTSLTTAPELPCANIPGGCYMGMFWNCTSLEKAPYLPATWVPQNAYRWMFANCSSLNEVWCDAVGVDQDAISEWMYGVDGVSLTGTFHKNPNIDPNSWDWPTDSNSGIPTGWTAVADNLFYLTNDDTTPVTISITKYAHVNPGDANNAPTISLEVSDNGTSWTTLGNTSTTALSFTIPVGGRKYLRSTSKNAWGANYESCSNQFSSTGKFGAHGSIMALLGYDTLKGLDCWYMFWNCSGLTTAPELPATTLAERCYAYMFWNCTSLVNAPKLPATNTLPQTCYYSMFRGCTSLTETPVLYATTLDQNSYGNMFQNCTSLNKVICNATDISAYHSTWTWLDNVASSGIFYKNADMSSWTTDASGIPSGWTVQDIQQ